MTVTARYGQPISRPLPRLSPWRLLGFRRVVVHQTVVLEDGEPCQAVTAAHERLLPVDGLPALDERLTRLER